MLAAVLVPPPPQVRKVTQRSLRLVPKKKSGLRLMVCRYSKMSHTKHAYCHANTGQDHRQTVAHGEAGACNACLPPADGVLLLVSGFDFELGSGAGLGLGLRLNPHLNCVAHHEQLQVLAHLAAL